MSALSDYLTREMTTLGIQGGGRELERRSKDGPEGEIDHSTAATYLNGKHPVKPTDQSLRKLAFAIWGEEGMEERVTEMRRLAGLPEPLGPYEPPEAAALLPRWKRKILDDVIRAMVTEVPGYELRVTKTEVDDGPTSPNEPHRQGGTR